MDPVTYGFSDVQATISGPGGMISLGAGAGPAEEGITVEFTEELDTMAIGADGQVAHSLHASRAGKITVRLLKTSPTNSLLEQMYTFQRSSSRFHGKNVIVISNPVTGDVYTCQQAAFAKFPSNSYSKVAGMLDWEFNAGQIDPTLGRLGAQV